MKLFITASLLSFQLVTSTPLNVGQDYQAAASNPNHNHNKMTLEEIEDLGKAIEENGISEESYYELEEEDVSEEDYIVLEEEDNSEEDYVELFDDERNDMKDSAPVKLRGTKNKALEENEERSMKGGVKEIYPPYMGCYKDDSSRDLKLHLGDNYSIDSCRAKCGQYNKKFAGLQAHGQCFCGDTFGSQGKALETECSLNCSSGYGDCGGFWRNSIYATTSYMGCYKDDSSRDLKLFIGVPYSIDSCRAECRQNNKKFAALQAHGYCFCGDTFGSQGKALETECSSNCSSGYGVCGGLWRNSIYAA